MMTVAAKVPHIQEAPTTGIVVVDEALRRFRAYSDGGAHSHHVMRRFHEAITRSSGEAAIEIGVRAGGTSAMMNAVAAEVRPELCVISVDPYGMAPYRHGQIESPSLYHDGIYLRAKELLAEFSMSTFFRLESEIFTAHLLPHFRWWVDGRCFPTRPQWIAFAYLDGQHGEQDVRVEVERIMPFMAPGGTLCIDDIQHIPDTVRWVTNTYGAQHLIEEFPDKRLALHLPGGR